MALGKPPVTPSSRDSAENGVLVILFLLLESQPVSCGPTKGSMNDLKSSMGPISLTTAIEGCSLYLGYIDNYHVLYWLE